MQILSYRLKDRFSILFYLIFRNAFKCITFFIWLYFFPTHNFSIQGTIKNAEQDIIFLSYLNEDNSFIKDSAMIKNSRFFFKGKVKSPIIAQIKLRDKNKREYLKEIWLERGNIKMTISTGDFKKIEIKNSKINSEYDNFNTIKKRVNNKYKKQLDSLKGLKDINVISGIRERLEPYFKELKEKELAFLTKNSNSFITPYILQFYTSQLPLDSLKMFYNRMDSLVQSSYYGQYLEIKIKILDRGTPGKQATDFTTKDNKGANIMLSQFKGNYLLLEFWASWCVPCRKEHPELKEIYKNYSPKGIQFIGIADDDSKSDAWAKAIEKDGLPWPQILRFTNSSNQVKQQDINELFGVQSLPTLLLIDKNGIIIGRFEENIQELKEKIRQIFSNDY